jgi:putative FmdB family regulatory protein
VPTYQYACTACDERLEVVQRFSDDPLTECGVCGGRLRKVFSPVGIVFKGSGFYRTDSRNGSNGASKAKDPQANGSSPESAKPASGDSGSSSGTDAKPSSGDAKTSKKTETAGAASSSASAAKVA